MKKYLSTPAIVSGIIAALIVLILIEPLMGFVWNLIVLFSDKIYSGYIDRIYESASLGVRNDIAFLIYLLMSLTIVMVTVGSFLSLLRRYTQLTDEEEVIPYPIKNIKRTLTFIPILFFIALSMVIVGLSSSYFDLQLNTSFQRRLNALAPALNDQELKEMRASWAQMNSRNDYEMLRAAMERIALERGVELPEALVD